MLGRDIALGLRRNGLACGVCSLEKGGELEADLKTEGIPYHIVQRRPDEYMSPMMRMYRFFRQVRPDIVHTHHLYELVYSVAAAKLVGAKIVHTEHEYFSLTSPKAKRLLRLLSIFCDRVTAVGDEVTDYLRAEVGIPAAKLLTISNGIDLKKFDEAHSRSKREIGFAESDRVIGIVARLERAKDHKTLFGAFARLCTLFPEVRLLVVGDGSLRAELKEECRRLGIEARVTFLGTRKDIPELLKLMDVFVLSSIEEGLPISMLEAMAAGLPVIATRVGSIPDVIADGVNGLLIEPGDREALSERLLLVLQDKERARLLGVAGKNTIRQRFNLSDTLMQYKRLYTELLER